MVKDFLSRATSKVSATFKKGSALVSSGICAANCALINAYAEDSDQTATMDGLMTQILKIIFNIFRYVGILLLVWSIIQIVLAFKNDDADSKQKGMVLAIISIVLITISFVIKPILTAAGFTYVE